MCPGSDAVGDVNDPTILTPRPALAQGLHTDPTPTVHANRHCATLGLRVLDRAPTDEKEAAMVGFDELKNKATEALGNEDQTDSALDKGADFVGEKTGGQHDDKIQQGRDFLDGKVGDENS
ncbi:MAG TPA: antitoxin [Candidatus Ruania gallistercoris]|uniref:Antitoxin n=1 Tax=Candidatus Ruania gallistercoris TaxID=2838746 RepID=A0A9D2J6Z0_9MICO|nr:antitoxin [Candidatus Ruania gallistercoris]